MKGVNLLPSALGKSQLEDRSAFGSIYPNDAQVLGKPSLHVLSRWFRSGDFKLIVPDSKNSKTQLSLFNLRTDPAESNNLIQGTNAIKYSQKVLQLRQLLDQWWPEGDARR